MKKIGWLKKTKVNKELKETEKDLAELVQTALEKQEIDSKRPVERKSFIEENCDQIMETTAQMEEFTKEYEAVTAYLTDISFIDQIPSEARAELNDAARKILTLTRERSKFQNSEAKITPKQYSVIEMFEDEIPNEVKKMNERESYQALLKKDLNHLEVEKASLRFEHEDLTKKQKYLMHMSMLISCMAAILCFVFLNLTVSGKLESNLPFYVTIALTLVAATFIIVEISTCRTKLSLNRRKVNKAVGLANRVKIKYINNQCSLDYSYSKFMVDNSRRLTMLWQEYVKQRDMEKKYQSNTELLNYYNEKLIKALTNYRVQDAEVWIHQCIALLDSKEMVEIRHRLNVRRQKLRDRLEYNLRMKEESIKNIRNIIETNPSAREEVITILRKYQIEL